MGPTTTVLLVLASLGLAAAAAAAAGRSDFNSAVDRAQEDREQPSLLLQQQHHHHHHHGQYEQDRQLQQQQQQEQRQSIERLLNEKSPAKLLSKKSVQDDEAIRAAEGYEFEYLTESSPDYSSSRNVEIEPHTSASHDDHDHHHPKVGYSAGGPLVNIAQGAAQQAHNFEKNQPAAAAQAAYVAKNRLGQSAGLSAATAAAAFAGKQIIYRGLEQQTYNAHRALEGEKLQLQQAQRAATAAANAAQQAMHQVQVVTTALNAAQATAEHAGAAAAAAAGELAAQTAMVGAAKARLQALEDQLHNARIDFEAAQAANMKAAHAAQVAQNNAAAAAAHAAEVANAQHKYHHDHGHKHHEHSHKHHDHGHSEHHSDLQEDRDYDHHESHESVSLPVLSKVMSTSSALSSGSKERDPKGRLPLSAAADYQGPLSTVSSVNNEETYDAYDSFPY